MKNAGEVYSLKVLRKTDIGYMLTDGEDEYFLHNRQSNDELKEDEVVLAFLFYDSYKRLTATLEKPSVTVNSPSWAKVKEVNYKIGIFMDINISKDILISKDFLPENYDLWPQVDDLLYIVLKSKNNQLVAKIVGKTLIDNREVGLYEGEVVDANVTRIMPEGISCYTEELGIIFIHKTQMRSQVRLGEKISVKVVKVLDNGEYNGTLINQKENQMGDDAKIILNYLEKLNGKMRYGNDSKPEDILKIFNMSKKAFKRALGNLYKERKIKFEDNYTLLVRDEK